MDLDTQLAELLAEMGVVLEAPAGPDSAPGMSDEPQGKTNLVSEEVMDSSTGDEEAGVSDLSLFQTSREHYGVFYRLDLVSGAPQLRVFLPDERGVAKMRGYVVRAAECAPLRDWFAALDEHDGSQVYDDARDATQQHLLFAAGELMKRFFWAGDLEGHLFPAEVVVRRVL
jgi:hypothetical protein